MVDPTNPVREALAAYQAAVRAKDVEAFAALYSEDIHVFDMWGAWSLEGLAAWRQMATDWFGSLGSETVLVEIDDLRSTLSGDLAVGHAVLTYMAVSAAGETLRSLNNRITLALRRTAGVWKIVHEHTSAPIDHQTLRASLKRA